MSLSCYLKSLADHGTYDASQITRKYEEWVRRDSYMVLCHQKEEWLDKDAPNEYIGVKCAKRGNDVYHSRVKSRLYGIENLVKDVEFDFGLNPYAQVLSVTLTYDTKLCSFPVGWKNIGIEFNRFKANIRKKYGLFSVFRTWESYENGHPHIHAIFVFQEYKFKVFRSYEKDKQGNPREVWLIDEKEKWEQHWHSWIKVKAVQSLLGGLKYLMKYILKCSSYEAKDRKGTLTLAMCWVFRKKAFYVSGEFRKALSDLISSLCSSKTRKVQVDLFGKELKANVWKVLGFVDAIFLESIGVNFANFWTIRFKPEEMEEIYADWEKVS
jgi:hypothetical protein